MSDPLKITSSHLARVAIVYLRQSSAAQVEHNRESTDRQYALVNKAGDLGWPTDKVIVIDEDLGVSGSGAVARSGFARLTAEVALGHVGLVLGLEVSRLARNNADWYRLIDLCGLSNTLIGDADGIYHPALFNDRLLLGLKGTMSAAELYLLVAGFSIAAKSMASRYNNAVCGDIDRGERNSNCFEGRNDEKPEMAMDSDEFELRAVPAICLTASEHRQPGPGAETALA